MRSLLNVLFFFARLCNSILMYTVFFAISEVLENRGHFKILVILIVSTGCLRYLLSVFLIRLYNSKMNFERDTLIYESVHHRFLEAVDSKNIYKKINLMVENIFCKEELYAAFCSITFMFLVYYYLLGYQSLIIFVIAVFTIPMVIFLRHYSEKFFTHVAESTESRNVLISNILKSRYSLVSSPSLFSNIIEKLGHIVNKEKKWRSLDSGFKTLETYLSLFYKYIPYLVGLLALNIISFGAPVDPKLYWMSIPVFSSILTFPRLFVNVKEYENGCSYLISHKIELPTHTNKIIFTGKDHVWRAPLKCNVPYMNEYIISIMKLLNLWQELRLSDVEEPFSFWIDPDKLSEGQKQRLTLLRAICLAKQSGAELIIECDFKALDLHNKKRIYKLLKELDLNKFIKLYYDKYLFDFFNEASVHESSYESDNIKELHKSHLETVNYNYDINKIGMILLFFVLFICVAAFDSYVASIISAGQLSRNIGLLIFSISIGSFLVAILTGVFLENSIRTSCFKNIFKSLSAPFVEKERIDKSVSVDLDICLEDFSYYVHDFLWVASLFLVALLAMILFMGSSGIFLSLCFSAFIAFLYLLGYRRVVESRDQFIHRAKLFVNVCENMLLADKVWSAILEKKLYTQIKNEIISVDVINWFESKCRLTNAKTLLSSKMQLGSSLAIASVVYIFGSTTGDISATALILTALLSVESESLRFFVALSGVVSTKNSALSILKLNTNLNTESIQVDYVGNDLVVNEYISKKTGIHYKRFKYSIGLNLVCGVSGAGKTTYFIDILKAVFLQPVQATFLTRVFFEEQMHKIGSFDKTVEFFFGDSALNDTHARLIIFDEVTHSVSDQALKNTLTVLSNLAQKKNIVLILSDHRVSCHNNCNVFNVGK